MPKIDYTAKVDALLALAARPNVKTAEPPTMIEAVIEYPWVSGGERRKHVFVLRMRLIAQESSGPKYEREAIVSETGIPPVAPRGAPDTMAIAWFAMPEYIAKGKIRPLPHR